MIAVAPAGRTARTAARASKAAPAAYNPGMDGNGTGEPRPLEQLLRAGLGWVSLTAEAADAIADDLARRVGIERDEMRTAVRDAVASWRAEVERIGALPAGCVGEGVPAPRARPP